MFNADLIDDLAREKVVLFLGAGVSASSVTQAGGRIAGWEKFLRDATGKVPLALKLQIDKLLDEKDYLLACELIQSNLEDSWQEIITTEFGQKASPSDLHKSIVQLKQRIIVTTNFDKLIESAYETVDRDATHYPTVISSVDDKVFRCLKDHSRRYIIKIHGSVDDTGSLVFSRSAYIKYAFGNMQYFGFLESLLLNYTVLFVGFSMNDPAIITLMEMYALRYPSARPHYIFAGGSVEQNIVEISKRLRKLVYIQYDPANDHEQLIKQVTMLGLAAHDRRKELAAASIA